ncbi:ATP-binding cassette domain-containing protein [Desemzia sp. RIT804]|uniref:multiple monosaccharide ABC transporter ATP-binding protein n=1 Tax=Desemzia sp. RIT 804 TaxID=2810209 RepID=UPI00194F0210|nr:multiple monosaccharide ABC transporter ATP-binding protein [Desemzia sp. RIT 804]MBM6614510.1 ATP-binding cassette domain-containing protein [Desemzia sp. RIT 804]
MSDIILEMKNITKDFSGVKALNNVNLKVKKGEIHALCGENGAGKSTLMKVLSGVYPFGEYTGDIIYNGEVCEFKSISGSEQKGVVIIHQELALIPYLSIKENIFLGNEQSKKGIIDWNLTEKKASNLLKTVGLAVSPNTLVTQLGVGQQQLVEIAKAFSKDVQLLILDEPTAALNEEDSKNLLELMKEFKKQGITSIIISHKLNEITEVADNVTIIRDGKSIETLTNEQIDENRIIKGMVGRDLTNRYPDRKPDIGQKIFEVKNWTVHHPIDTKRKVNDNIDFYINAGEIVGIAGLMGAGRTEFAMSLFGKSYGHGISGQIIKDGKEIKINNVSDAIKNRIAYLSEDRKNYGLNLLQDIKENITIASLSKIAAQGVIDKEKEIIEAEKYRDNMRIKTKDIYQNVASLSGGNQQKVVLGKWLMSEPDILFLDEPTRGIDVGAKFEIYSIIEQMAREGKAICIISSELPEILGMCDRIYTMNEGRFTGNITKNEATQENLMKLMTAEEAMI